MKAKFSGKCGICGKYHIRAGEDIEPVGNGSWAPPPCILRKTKIDLICKKIEAKMLTAGYGFGCWGIDESLKPTFSMNEFFTTAKNLSLCTEEEYSELFRFYQNVWHRDLSD